MRKLGPSAHVLRGPAGFACVVVCLSPLVAAAADSHNRLSGDANRTPQSVEASLTANRDTTIELRFGQHVEKLELKKGEPRTVNLRR